MRNFLNTPSVIQRSQCARNVTSPYHLSTDCKAVTICWGLTPVTPPSDDSMEPCPDLSSPYTAAEEQYSETQVTPLMTCCYRNPSGLSMQPGLSG